MPRVASKIGATIKGKNLLPGSKFFPLRAAPICLRSKIFHVNVPLLKMFVLSMVRTSVMFVMSAMPME